MTVLHFLVTHLLAYIPGHVSTMALHICVNVALSIQAGNVRPMYYPVNLHRAYMVGSVPTLMGVSCVHVCLRIMVNIPILYQNIFLLVSLDICFQFLSVN